jgi:nitrite reductase (NADH) large subunit
MYKKDEIICHCMEITYQVIIDAIQNGAKTVEEITNQTDAGLSCGTCIETIEEILEDLK